MNERNRIIVWGIAGGLILLSCGVLFREGLTQQSMFTAFMLTAMAVVMLITMMMQSRTQASLLTFVYPSCVLIAWKSISTELWYIAGGIDGLPIDNVVAWYGQPWFHATVSVVIAIVGYGGLAFGWYRNRY